ncbi:hypothetical protein SDC9_180907 [bioreactor metagenome]|uniref:Uncharacterized protein n=1 Tax=bioreactor metagenome TaxID=1076179 RepID=A0A645H3X7_9ZZZZ
MGFCKPQSYFTVSDHVTGGDRCSSLVFRAGYDPYPAADFKGAISKHEGIKEHFVDLSRNIKDLIDIVIVIDNYNKIITVKVIDAAFGFGRN